LRGKTARALLGQGADSLIIQGSADHPTLAGPASEDERRSI